MHLMRNLGTILRIDSYLLLYSLGKRGQTRLFTIVPQLGNKAESRRHPRGFIITCVAIIGAKNRFVNYLDML